MGVNMPLRKKKNIRLRTVAILVIIAIILVFMIISFQPVQNITEIVLA